MYRPPSTSITPYEEILRLRAELQNCHRFYNLEIQRAHQETTAAKEFCKKNHYSEIPVKFNNSKESYWDLGKSARLKKRKRVAQHVRKVLDKLPKEFHPVAVKFRVHDKELTMSLNDDGEEIDDEKEEEEKKLIARKVLAAKDRGFISDEAYHELRMAQTEEIKSQMPCLNQIIEVRREENQILDILPIPQAKNGDGCRRRILDILHFLLQISSVRTAINNDGRIIRARFAADGRRTSAKIGSVMAVISLLAEGINNADHQYTVALYNGKEDYEEIKSCFGETFKEIHLLSKEGLVFEGVQFKVEWSCCCDWKFLAIVYGLNAACSKYFCIWCFCTKDLINDLEIEDWPMTRTLEECKEKCKHRKTEDRKGCINEPLLQIPFESVVTDILHLFLRIMGMLFGQVADLVINHDKKIDLVNAMEDISCPFKFYEVQDENGQGSCTKFTKLDGKDLKKVLLFLDIEKVLDGVNVDTDGIIELWSGFQTLMKSLSAKPDEEHYLTPAQFKMFAREWGQAYLQLNHAEDVTPYIHAMVYHVPQMLERFGTIKQFNCQPVEKKNHLQNQVFHRGSQKGGKGTKYTKQILERENRQLFVKKYNLIRQRRRYRRSGLEDEEAFEGFSQYERNSIEG